MEEAKGKGQGKAKKTKKTNTVQRNRGHYTPMALRDHLGRFRPDPAENDPIALERAARDSADEVERLEGRIAAATHPLQVARAQHEAAVTRTTTARGTLAHAEGTERATAASLEAAVAAMSRLTVALEAARGRRDVARDGLAEADPLPPRLGYYLPSSYGCAFSEGLASYGGWIVSPDEKETGRIYKVETVPPQYPPSPRPRRTSPRSSTT